MNFMKLFCIYVLLYSISFLLEICYQRFCFPISIMGYFTNILTLDNSLCYNIRHYSFLIQGFVTSTMIQTVSIMIMSLIDTIKKHMCIKV